MSSTLIGSYLGFSVTLHLFKLNHVSDTFVLHWDIKTAGDGRGGGHFEDLCPLSRLNVYCEDSLLIGVFCWQRARMSSLTSRWSTSPCLAGRQTSLVYATLLICLSMPSRTYAKWKN